MCGSEGTPVAAGDGGDLTPTQTRERKRERRSWGFLERERDV